MNTMSTRAYIDELAMINSVLVTCTTSRYLHHIDRNTVFTLVSFQRSLFWFDWNAYKLYCLLLLIPRLYSGFDLFCIFFIKTAFMSQIYYVHCPLQGYKIIYEMKVVQACSSRISYLLREHTIFHLLKHGALRVSLKPRTGVCQTSKF